MPSSLDFVYLAGLFTVRLLMALLSSWCCFWVFKYARETLKKQQSQNAKSASRGSRIDQRGPARKNSSVDLIYNDGRVLNLVNTALRIALCTCSPLLSSVTVACLWMSSYFDPTIDPILHFIAAVDIGFNSVCLLMTFKQAEDSLYHRYFGWIHSYLLSAIQAHELDSERINSGSQPA